ncbi:ATP-dependent metallopeptidase HflB family protein, partial [Chlamydia psittaci 02DC14]
EVEPQKISF